MKKKKRKLTATEKKAKAERQKKYEWVFMNGKQVRVKRPQLIDGMDVDEFIQRNADPIWLHQNEMWELMEQHDIIISEEDEKIDQLYWEAIAKDDGRH